MGKEGRGRGKISEWKGMTWLEVYVAQYWQPIHAVALKFTRTANKNLRARLLSNREENKTSFERSGGDKRRAIYIGFLVCVECHVYAREVCAWESWHLSRSCSSQAAVLGKKILLCACNCVSTINIGK